MSIILVVDDDDCILQLLNEILTDEGYTTLLAHNAQKALEICQYTQPDLILVDYAMPVTSGTQLCRILQAKPLFADVQFILFSAMRETEFINLCHYDAFVSKPFIIDDLLDLLAQMLKGLPTNLLSHAA